MLQLTSETCVVSFSQIKDIILNIKHFFPATLLAKQEQKNFFNYNSVGTHTALTF